MLFPCGLEKEYLGYHKYEEDGMGRNGTEYLLLKDGWVGANAEHGAGIGRVFRGAGLSSVTLHSSNLSLNFSGL